MAEAPAHVVGLQSQSESLLHHLRKVRNLHQGDLALGWGEVVMPYAL